MECVEGSGVPVLYKGRKAPKVTTRLNVQKVYIVTTWFCVRGATPKLGELKQRARTGCYRYAL
jgi:hypothetical protein